MDTKLSFEQFINDVSSILNLNTELLKPETDIYCDIGIDSLKLISLGSKLKELYKIELSSADFIESDTIEELYETVCEVIK